MADNTTTTIQPSVKKYVDYAQQQVDEQAILDKYNAATIAQYNIQREQNKQAENQFYNQMYNTQRTALDTIRQTNAAAVSSGASRGVQAANELSALLGLQSESVASATELAQANRQTAQEETAAVLENVLNAYQQATQEKQQLISQAIESASVDAQEAANQVAAAEAETNRMNVEQTQRDSLQKAAQTDFASYLAEVAGQGKNYQGEYSLEGANSLNQALSSLTAKGEGQANDGTYFSKDDFKTTDNDALARQKYDRLLSDLDTVTKTYGIDVSKDKIYNETLQQIKSLFTTDSDRKSTKWYEIIGDVLTVGMVSAGKSIAEAVTKGDRAAQAQALYQTLVDQLKNRYAAKAQSSTNV